MKDGSVWPFYRAGKIIFGTRVAVIGLLFFIWHPDLCSSHLPLPPRPARMFFRLVSACAARQGVSGRRCNPVRTGGSVPSDQTTGWKDTNIDYLVLANGRPIARGKVGEIPRDKYFSFSLESGLPFTPVMTLELILRISAEISVDDSKGPVIAFEYIDLQ